MKARIVFILIVLAIAGGLSYLAMESNSPALPSGGFPGASDIRGIKIQ